MKARPSTGGAHGALAACAAATPSRAEARTPRMKPSATDRRSDASASALRLPDPQAPLRALHAGDGRGGLRRSARGVPARSPRPSAPNPGRERTACHLLRGRLDAALDWRADHPRRRHPPAPARQHRAARRRHPGAARPRLDPGLDRHPDALRHAARLSADADAFDAATARCGVHRARQVADRLVAQPRRPSSISLLKAWYGDAATAGRTSSASALAARSSPATTRTAG